MLNEALPFAQQMLDRHGEFYPYALKMTADGQTGMAAADPGEGDHPDSQTILSMLHQGLSSERDGLRATAMVSDVRIASAQSDAIRVEIEHREGVSVAVLLPYSKKRLGRGVTYGDLQAGSGDRRIWPESS
jgi:hypothetical protein